GGVRVAEVREVIPADVALNHRFCRVIDEGGAPDSGPFLFWDSSRISAAAVTRWSGPAYFWISPMANIIAMRAFARAVACAAPCWVVRSVTTESDSSPMMMTLSKVINMMDATKLNPRCRARVLYWDFIGVFMRHRMT